MRGKKIKFIEDGKGVSNIIGTLLIFAILVSLFGAFQTTMVPVWNKGVEYDHLDVVYGDMMSLKSDIEDVALHTSPKSSEIHLGVRYPERAIFMNPGEGAAGMLTVEKGVKIIVEYAVLNISGVATLMEPLTFYSSRITYELYGTIGSPKYVYEHGILIRDYGTSNVTTDEQPLIINDNIYIPVVNATANFTKSSLDVESLAIYPSTQAPITPRVKYVNVTMETEYPEIWKDLLADVNESNDYTNASVSVEEGKIYINCTAGGAITSPSEEAAGTLSAGIITFGTATGALSWPYIVDIDMTETEVTAQGIIRSIINATVKNVTAPLDIHASLADLTMDPTQCDVQPDWSYPNSIDDVSWSLPNSPNVSWDVSHPAYKQGGARTTATITFRVENIGSGAEFTTIKVFYVKNNVWTQ
nr:conserved hypothetical protein [uncultured archaeon GZfos9D8]